jgi:uncharacterized SAM-binding protein YcdF (DUF218 family)
MFLFLSKLLPLFVYPVGLASLLLAVALAAGRRKWLQRSCSAGALALLFVFGNHWVALRLLASLEWRYLPETELPEAQAIVLLGGGTRPQLPPRPMSEISEAGDRMIFAARLFHEGKAPVIVATGGFIEFFGAAVPETEAMAELLIRLGVPDAAILRESKAQNTHDNGVFVRELLEPRGITRILLVTSALHMPRSVAIFRQQGFEVIPAPTDFLVTWGEPGRTVEPGWGGELIRWLPTAENLDFSTRALREYLGIAVYRARGWL